MTERQQPESEYWNADEAIGDVTLWRGQRYALRLKAHVAEEIYRRSEGQEIIPLAHSRGVRTYVHGKPYILVPDITLDIGLSPQPEPSGAIGAVRSSNWEGMRHEEIGQAQAWFYVEDRTIVLWESYLLDRYRAPKMLEDSNTYALWQGFEQFLTRRFPSARQLVTTYDDSEYDTDQYQEFLTSLGYRRLNPAAFGKDLTENRS
jgi:hypothetical protein